MRLLDAAGAHYSSHHLDIQDALSGREVAEKLGIEAGRVFKTLVTEGKSREHYVFLIPVAEELDLKKAAKAVGEKAIHMIRAKELLPLTGYVHGGCSPLGMKKAFVTVIDETAILYDHILFSAGRIGHQIEIAPDEFGRVFDFTYSDIIVDG